MTLRPLLALATLALLTACGGGVVIELDDPPPAPQPRPNPQPNPPTLNCSTAGLAAAAQSRWPVVCMLTSSGEMVFELYDSYAPVTVNNFLALVARDFYTQTLVHRVDRDFVFQGGGFNSGMREKLSPFQPIALEDNNGLSNLRGTLSMARRSSADSATSQWFVNVRDNSALDYTPVQRGYAVFGQIISGLPVVDAINVLPVYRYSDTDLRPQTEVLTYWVRRIQ
ncbi:peptidylprolyl isomerase [Pseudorhodoferax sp.]|jgi:peptidyl-prolyl cis-trans isomerase A (cyclophilin A)|uniref:peptidylprolyl isomerase n=1 Tax=Pseudorhodoferax sp. TaxID=1993553 RepID=UPI001B5E3571|nr:peptidylprolyl isomerase [Pseudorhodoferax sp.]MBP8144633.1 peptidylprolyl isomerase [Inhella sp.]